MFKSHSVDLFFFSLKSVCVEILKKKHLLKSTHLPSRLDNKQEMIEKMVG